MKKILTVLILILIALKLYAPDCREQLAKIAIHVEQLKLKAEADLKQYLDALAIEETGDSTMYPWRGFKTPYHVINSIGAAGRWQLTAIARKDIKYNGSLKHFLNSPSLQKKCVIQLMKNNKKYLQYYIPNYQDYIGKTIHGVTISYAGLISACHLAGIGSVQKFLKTGHIAVDRNGTTIVKYMKKFQNYKIGLSI